MKVLIVAKTKMGGNVCVGGLDEQGGSVRLKEEDESFPSPSTYDVGDLWEITSVKPEVIVPPHVETVLVVKREKVGSEANLRGAIGRLVKNPWRGDIAGLYEGKLGVSSKGNGYIEAPNIPSRSTWFWLPDADLRLESGHYRYGTGPFGASYVGVEPAIPRIPAGTLVRVSLAGWWKPSNAAEDFPERCYLQLSGWYP